MSRSAALKAHVTMRAKRAAEDGVVLELEQPLNIEGETDFGFEECHECRQPASSIHICTSKIREARETVLRSLSPPLRAWGWAWVTFILGEGPRPTRPTGFDTRQMELRIAACGLVDPDGFWMGADLVRCKRRPGTKRRGRKQRQPDALRQHRLDRINHDSGASHA